MASAKITPQGTLVSFRKSWKNIDGMRTTFIGTSKLTIKGSTASLIAAAIQLLAETSNSLLNPEIVLTAASVSSGCWPDRIYPSPG